MAIAAQQDGLLSLDEPASKTLTEWQGDPLREKITLRQLLNLTSGIPGGNLGRIPTYQEAVQSPAEAPPGTRFSYGPVPFQIFGEVMRRKLGGDPLAYLQRRIFQPIGLEYAFWRRGPDGNPHLPSGAFLTARNWARFGELVRQGGVWQGQRVVDAALLDRCFEPSQVNPLYGLSWWLARPIDRHWPGRPTLCRPGLLPPCRGSGHRRWSGWTTALRKPQTRPGGGAAGPGQPRVFRFRLLTALAHGPNLRSQGPLAANPIPGV